VNFLLQVNGQEVDTLWLLAPFESTELLATSKIGSPKVLAFYLIALLFNYIGKIMCNKMVAMRWN
jgi:hypothetical protein